MTFDLIMFYIFSAGILFFSLLSVTSHKVLRAAFFLLLVLIATAALFFMLQYQFLAAVQITLYAGGIVVLIIFAILLTHQVGSNLEPIDWKKNIFSALVAIGGALITILVILETPFKVRSTFSTELTMQMIGRQLISTDGNGYALPFEVISILLLASMIGAIVVARKRKDTP